MTREKILETLKDYIMTLRSPNIHVPVIKSAITERSLLIRDEMEKIAKVDRDWVNTNLVEWMEKDVIPKLSKGRRKILKMNGYLS